MRLPEDSEIDSALESLAPAENTQGPGASDPRIPAAIADGTTGAKLRDVEPTKPPQVPLRKSARIPLPDPQHVAAPRPQTPVSGSPIVPPKRRTAPMGVQTPVRKTGPLASTPRPHKPSQQTEVLGSAPPPPDTVRSRHKEQRRAIELNDNLQVDRFGLIREIARGGMGQVFLARDTKLGRKVAIKFLLHDDPNFAQRFLVEARATARCTHENIVSIYEVGEYDGLPYMVLEYLEGKTLSQVLEGSPGLKQFAEIMLAVARALERAHEHGIVHRDLKPSNIFVTDRGQVKVLDFGVARVLDQIAEPAEAAAIALASKLDFDSEQHTYVTFSSGNTLVGTFPYMSPEQWGAARVDHRSDLWACGIMFWRALTQVHPAGTNSGEQLRARLCDISTPLPSIGARDPSLPPKLVAIVDKLLQKRADDRYQSATDLITDLQAFLLPSSERLSEDVCPYRGLASFGEADAKFFFGRSNEIRTGLAQLDAWPMLAVIGPSGVGKSSFVNAGLIPAIRNSGGHWDIRILRPGRAPLASLAKTLGDDLQSLQEGVPIVDQLREAPGLFGEYLRRDARRRKRRFLIVVDQLEELFTLSDDDDTRKLFLSALLAAADDPSAPVRVVLSMRADFLDRLASHKQFLAELARGLFFLSAPDKDNLRETIVRPAELAGYTFEDPAIVDDMMQSSTSKGALPLVQFTANRMWDARDAKRKLLTLTAYREMGGVGGAFAKHADETAATVPPQHQALLRAIMTRLVTPEGTRAVVDYRELLGLADDAKEVESVLDRLVHSRLVLLQSDTEHGNVVEIVHEVLITKWPTLVRWLEDSQALRGFLQELRLATRQWLARNRASDLVWRGATATEALATHRKHVLDLSTNEREFLAAADAELRRARLRKRLTIGASLAVLALLIGVGVLWGIQTQQKNAEVEAANVIARKNLAEAQAAKTQIQQQLDEIKAAEARREAAEAQRKEAEAEKAKADVQVARSHEDLEKANAELVKALDDAQKEKFVAQDAAKRAAQAADVAKKATEAAKAAQANVEKLLKVEQQRVKELEAEKAKISTKRLDQ